MKLLFFISLIGVLNMSAFAQAPRTADDVLNSLQNNVIKTLLEGNQRYLDQKMHVCSENTTKATREQLAKGQKPYAIILSCSDSRVPPELIFDQDPGDIFVVRVAGNIVDPILLGSIEYAAEHLGSPIIVVLGHERCGAVTAAVKSHGPAEGNIGSIIEAITPAVEEAKKKATGINEIQLVENAIDENIHLVAQNIFNRSSVIRHLMQVNKIKMIEAKFDLDEGKVNLFPEVKYKVVPEETEKQGIPNVKKFIYRKKESVPHSEHEIKTTKEH